jgi:hypothetical protein
MYSITYKTKKGGSGIMITSSFAEIKKKAQQLCRQKLEATIYNDGAKIGQVWWMDYSDTRTGWNYSIENEMTDEQQARANAAS